MPKNTGRLHRVFSGKLLKVYRQRIRFPNGYVGDLEIIRHPGAILVVPFLDSDTVVMLRQYRPVIGRYLWELPAGTLKTREPLLACARRELGEETGYRAAKWQRVGCIYPAPGYTTEKIHLFLARSLAPLPQAHREEDELIEVRPLSRKAIVKMFREGTIDDAKTICALRYAGIL
jgi:ADP-ribose pyrophosphatase